MKIIYITGIDGCGKTTQSKMLVDHLNVNQVSSQYQWLRWSPSVVRLINFIKKNKLSFIKKSKSTKSTKDMSLQLQENADFKDWSAFKTRLFSSTIFKYIWLKYAVWDYFLSYIKSKRSWKSEVVVLDRYYFDFIVDQSINFNENITDFQSRIENSILKNVVAPDLFILIEIAPETGWERKRDGTSLSHLKKLNKVYSSVKFDDNVIIIDGNLPVQMINEEINKVVLDFLRV